MMKKLIGIALSLIMTTVSITSCTKGNENSSNQDSKIVLAIAEDLNELDPTINNQNIGSMALHNLFTGLYKLDQTNTPVPAYAKEYTLSEDELTYTFTLKDDAKWSDGSPLTAYDFEYSWKRVLNPETASKQASELFYIKNGQKYFEGLLPADEVGVKALDEKTLEVQLENVTAFFLELITGTEYCPVKKELVESGSDWKKSADAYVSNGPFMMKDIKIQEKYTMVKNPNYVDADNVKIDVLEMVYIDSREAEIAAYLSGEINISNELSADTIKMFKDTPEYKVVNRIGNYILDFNILHEPFDDPRVRKALSYAIDREMILSILNSNCTPLYGVVVQGMPDLTDPSKTFRDTVGDVFKYDPEYAKQLLAEAGYANGEGFPKFRYISTTSQSDKDVAQALQAMWKDTLGIECTIDVFESKVYWDEQVAGNFDVMRDGNTATYSDPIAILELYDRVKQSYQTHWENDRYSELIELSRQTTDQSKRMEYFIEAEKVAMEDMPIAPIYSRVAEFLAKPNIKGLHKNYSGHFYFEYAYIED